MKKAILSGYLMNARQTDNNNILYLSFISKNNDRRYIPETLEWINANIITSFTEGEQNKKITMLYD